MREGRVEWSWTYEDEAASVMTVDFAKDGEGYSGRETPVDMRRGGGSSEGVEGEIAR